MELKKKDWFWVGGSTTAVGILGWVAAAFGDGIQRVVLASAVTMVVVVTLLIALRQLQLWVRNQNLLTYWQIEPLFSIYATLSPDAPLPAMRDWALSPDLGNLLVRTLFEHRPRVIVELGSGTSTVLMALTLKRLGLDAKIYSIDHDAEFLQQTRLMTEQHGVARYCHLVHAPLISLEDFNVPWYDLSHFPLPDLLSPTSPQLIDLLFIDGPPFYNHPLTRYPALPLLRNRLAPTAIVILDDANRPQEQAVLARWRQEYPDWVAELLPTEKGTALLKQRAPS